MSGSKRQGRKMGRSKEILRAVKKETAKKKINKVRFPQQVKTNEPNPFAFDGRQHDK